MSVLVFAAVVVVLLVVLNFLSAKVFEALFGGFSVVLKRFVDPYRRRRSLRHLPDDVPPPPVI